MQTIIVKRKDLKVHFDKKADKINPPYLLVDECLDLLPVVKLFNKVMMTPSS